MKKTMPKVLQRVNHILVVVGGVTDTSRDPIASSNTSYLASFGHSCLASEGTSCLASSDSHTASGVPAGVELPHGLAGSHHLPPDAPSPHLPDLLTLSSFTSSLFHSSFSSFSTYSLLPSLPSPSLGPPLPSPPLGLLASPSAVVEAVESVRAQRCSGATNT